MDDRLRALKSISSHLPAGLLGNPGALQKFLEDRTQVVARDLQVGMVLSRDLLTPNGLLMLSAGHTLDERLIHKIMDFEKSGCLQLTAYIRLDRRT